MESPKAAGPNAQAGPSNPFQSSHAPSAADEEELNRISASLSQRSHRRSSVFSSATRKAGKAGKTVTSRIPIPPNLKRHESDDEAEYEGLDEDEICRLEQKKYEKRREEALKEIRERSGVIDIVGNVEGGSDRGVKGDKQEYVWDVLFENQRGLYLLGKAYFSSRTLLPADPSAYTLPSHSLPSASSFTVSQPASDGVNTTRSEHRVQAKHQKKEQGKRGITTAYTLDTFQTPSPAWIWLTPWMTNMRPGTDESGWRYNYWFKSNGWKSHAGLAGWGGWVRRREWVRLRCLNPEEEVLDGPKEPELDVGPHQSLGQVMKKNEVDGIVKALSKVALDRQKLETWDVWLKEASQDEKDKLERILSDEDHLHKISRSFTYQSSFASLKATLADYDIRLSSSIGGTPTTISPHDPSTPDTEKGYDVPRPTSKPDQQGTPSISPKHDIDD